MSSAYYTQYPQFVSLFHGLFQGSSNTALTLSQPASAFDAVRICTTEWYSSQGAKRCWDVPTGGSSVNIGLPFYEGANYQRLHSLSWASGTKQLKPARSQQVNWAENAQSWNRPGNQGITDVWGIKYFTNSAIPGAISGDRTLIFSGNHASGTKSITLSQPASSFYFLEMKLSENAPLYIIPTESASIYACNFAAFQSTSLTFQRTTQWRTYGDTTKMSGSRYCQERINNWTIEDQGNIPALYGRNVGYTRIWGVGKK